VTVISADCALADAAATAIGNRIFGPEDFESAITFGKDIPNVEGILVISGDKMGAWGDVKLVPL